MAHIPRLREYRMMAILSMAALARIADVDRETVARAENGFSVRDIKCVQILYGLNKVEPFLAKPLPMSSIEDGGRSGRQSTKAKRRRKAAR